MMLFYEKVEQKDYGKNLKRLQPLSKCDVCAAPDVMYCIFNTTLYTF